MSAQDHHVSSMNEESFRAGCSWHGTKTTLYICTAKTLPQFIPATYKKTEKKNEPTQRLALLRYYNPLPLSTKCITQLNIHTVNKEIKTLIIH